MITFITEIFRLVGKGIRLFFCYFLTLQCSFLYTSKAMSNQLKTKIWKSESLFVSFLRQLFSIIFYIPFSPLPLFYFSNISTLYRFLIYIPVSSILILSHFCLVSFLLNLCDSFFSGSAENSITYVDTKWDIKLRQAEMPDHKFDL